MKAHSRPLKKGISRPWQGKFLLHSLIIPDSEYWQRVGRGSPSRDSHPFHELIYVWEGTYRVIVEGKKYQLQPGQMIYYPPGMVHKPHNIGSMHLQFSVCQWEEAGGDGLGRPRVVEDKSGRMAAALRWIWDASAPGLGREGVCTALIQAIVLESLMPGKAELPVGMVERVILYLRSNLRFKLPLSQLAHISGISKFLLQRRFKAATGLSPLQYLTRLRVERAVNLLCTSRLPLKLTQVAGILFWGEKTFSPLRHLRIYVESRSLYFAKV